MVIALLGEGKNDYGIEARNSWQEGAVQPLLRRIEGFNDAEIIPVRKNRNRTVAPGRKHKKCSFTILCLRSFMIENTEIDLIIVYKDCDKTSGESASKREAIRKHSEVYQTLKSELNEFKNEFRIDSIPMVPIRMLENWLLGDNNAYIAVWENQPNNPSLPNEPEFIWGDEQDNNSNHPKNYIRRVLNQYDEDYSTENFIKIAENINLTNLKRTCENSFTIFYDDIMQIINN